MTGHVRPHNRTLDLGFRPWDEPAGGGGSGNINWYTVELHHAGSKAGWLTRSSAGGVLTRGGGRALRTSAEPLPRGGGRRDRVTQVYEEIRSLIVRGRLAPGARVVEAEVVHRLGISRTPVRSALHRLQQEGYLTAPRSGRRARPAVTALTMEDATEVFTVVGEVEGMAAERAAELPPMLRRKLVQELTRINIQYQRASSSVHPSGDELFRLDTLFHQTYVDAGAGPRLAALHAAIKPQTERYIRVYQTALLDAIQTSVREHQLIIERIAAGQPPAAQQAVRSNWRNAAGRLRAVIGTRGETGAW